MWMEAMSKEVDGLVAAGTFAEVTEIPGGCNIVDAKRLYKRKGDSHGMVDRAKARMVAMEYSYVGRGGRLLGNVYPYGLRKF